MYWAVFTLSLFSTLCCWQLLAPLAHG